MPEKSVEIKELNIFIIFIIDIILLKYLCKFTLYRLLYYLYLIYRKKSFYFRIYNRFSKYT